MYLRILLLYGVLAVSLLLSGCGHGPWFHGQQYNNYHPRYPATYENQCDNYYYGRYKNQSNCWRD